MKSLLSTFALFCFFTAIFAQKNSVMDISARIITNNSDNMLDITATATNNSTLYRELNYILVSVKEGKSGTSSNKQSGRFTLNPTETKKLSHISLNVSSKDALKIFLLIKDEKNQALVAKDSLIVNGDTFKKKEVVYIPENKIELFGFTVDETKTGVGKNFYDIFYMKYNQLPKQPSGTVKVEELPTMGRSTRIQLSFDDQIFYGFITKPDEEFLTGEAETSIAQLQKILQKQNTLQNEFKY